MEAIAAKGHAGDVPPVASVPPVRRAVWLHAPRYDVVRIVLSLILIAAAWLKAHSLMFHGVGGTGRLASMWSQLAIFEVESAVGLWMLAGFFPRVTRWIAVAYFGLLASVAAYHAISGDPSCGGCLGPFTGSPSAMFAFDVTAVLALTFASHEPIESPKQRRSGWDKTVIGWALLALGCLAILFGVATAIFGSPIAALAQLRGEQVVIEPAVLDAGECAIGEQRLVEFIVRNRGNSPVRIIGATTTCVCVSTAGLPIVVPPHEERPVSVTLKFVSSPDSDFTHTITLYLEGDFLRMLQGRVQARLVSPPHAGTPESGG